MLLAIETSCDETAIALMRLTDSAAGPAGSFAADVVSSQVKLHLPYGGVVPELAAREHVNNLPLLVDGELKKAGIGVGDLTAVAVTRGPGLKGCLLVGLCYAKSLCLSQGLPLIPIHHIEGHLYAGWLMPPEEQPELPMLSLVVSGGHTMLVYVEGFRRYRVVARTRDDAAGEAFDKAATLLGLPYPGGPSLSKAAAAGAADAYTFPVGVTNDPASFSFSGLKTAVLRTVSAIPAERLPEVRNDLAASVEHAIVRALVDKSIRASDELQPRSFLLTGGVAANLRLRAALNEAVTARGIRFCVPQQRWCTDNAAMIALLGREMLQLNQDRYRTWRPAPGPLEYLGPGVPADIGALPKWPLEELTSTFALPAAGTTAGKPVVR